jgi:hypothetical protein
VRQVNGVKQVKRAFKALESGNIQYQGEEREEREERE